MYIHRQDNCFSSLGFQHPFPIDSYNVFLLKKFLLGWTTDQKQLVTASNFDPPPRPREMALTETADGKKRSS